MLIIQGGEEKRLADEYAEKAAKKKEEEKQALLNSLFKSVRKSQEDNSDNSDDEEEEFEESGEIDLYVDQRDQIYGDGEDDGEKKKNRTEKICRFFLDAVEANKYGWRWNCPNGRECIYQHKLPLGFVLKRDGNAVVLEDNTPLEEKLEEERSQLTGGTPVTLERFLKWKEEKKSQREREWEEKRLAEAKKTGTKGLNVLSGRALFKYDPT
jgi:DRG Family Regulatory Proteins, Tma46